MIRSLILSGALALSGFAQADKAAVEPVLVKKATLHVDKARVVSVLGRVDGRIIEKANELMKLAKSSREPIYVFINSPGGSVRAGDVFIDAMTVVKSRGIEIKCVTSIYAASMAFSILVNCTDRYVLPNTRLLFHPVRAGLMGSYTGIEMAEIGAELNEMDTTLQDLLVSKTGIDREVMKKAYYAEKWWKAPEIQAATTEGWLTIVDDITGIEALFLFEPKEVTASDFLPELQEYGHVFINAPIN